MYKVKADLGWWYCLCIRMLLVGMESSGQGLWSDQICALWHLCPAQYHTALTSACNSANCHWYIYMLLEKRIKLHTEIIQEGIARTSLSHQVAERWGWGTETAWVNKDYVTQALMSFPSKQLLPPSFYLIKVFHLQQIQLHALLVRWQKKCTLSAERECAVSRVVFLDPVLVKWHIVSLSVTFFFFFVEYNICSRIIVILCKVPAQKQPDVEPLCQQTIWWHWIRGSESCFSDICLTLSTLFIYFWTYDLWFWWSLLN